MTEEKREVTFEITEHLGELSINKDGWIREVNMVKWNEGKPKLDIREWATTHERMNKGVRFTDEEVIKLKEILNAMDI